MEPGLDPPSRCSKVSSLSSTLSVPSSASAPCLAAAWCLAPPVAVGILLLRRGSVAPWPLCTSATSHPGEGRLALSGSGQWRQGEDFD